MSESFAKQVWDTFTAIDVKPLMEKNGNTDYITWSRIWEVIMSNYPESSYRFEDNRVPGLGENGPTETVEVICTLTISKGGECCSRSMHLPVMQSRVPFAAIEMPTARNISDSKMRCLVKCAAMHGLGLSLWSGDDTYKSEEDPNRRTIEFAKLRSKYRMDLWKTAIVIKEAIAIDTEQGRSIALEAWSECSEEDMKYLWLAESKGGFFTQSEKVEIRKLRVTEE